MRRCLMFIVAAIACAGSLGVPAAHASAQADPVREQERLRAEQLTVAAELDVMRADLAKIEEALRVLDENVAAQQLRLAAAEQEVARAVAEEERAVTAVERASRTLGELDRERARQAVAAYVQAPTHDVLELFRTEDLNDASRRNVFLGIRASQAADLSDRLAGARKDLNVEKRRAADAHREARATRADHVEQADEVAAARAQQATFAEAVKVRIAESVATSLRLAQTDRELSARIALEQAALATRLAAIAAAESEAALRRVTTALAEAKTAADKEALAAELAAVQGRRVQGGRVPTAEGVVTVNPGEAPRTGSGGVNLVTVGGITVNALVAESVAAMVNAAAADGVRLTGGGYRDPAQQIVLRQAHCGTSYEAVYIMSASSCRPPTAPPGKSMHEVGLAIDFESCSTRSTACYQWLSANAARFGFINLPSEPWHWSINGN